MCEQSNKIKTVKWSDECLKQFGLAYIEFEPLYNKHYFSESTSQHVRKRLRAQAYGELAARLGEDCAGDSVPRHMGKLVKAFHKYFLAKLQRLVNSVRWHAMTGTGTADEQVERFRDYVLRRSSCGWLKRVEDKLRLLSEVIRAKMHAAPGRKPLPIVVLNVLGALRAAAADARDGGEPYAAAGRRCGLSGRAVRLVWDRICVVATKKLRILMASGDQPALVSRSTRMSYDDWRAVDLVLMYDDDFAVVSESSTLHFGQLQALLRLLQLVQAYGLEENGHVAAWLDAHKAYASRGLEASPVLLQRRWHELKRFARRALADWWRRRELQPPHQIFQAVLARFPHVMTSPLPSWSELVKAGKIYNVALDELDHENAETMQRDKTGTEKIKALEGTDAMNTEDDLILIEEDIETIDLARDSDEESPLVIEEDRDPCVDIKQEINHKQNLTTERMHIDLGTQFNELENNIDGKRLENTGHTDGIEQFVNSSEDNSIDRTQINCNLIRKLLQKLRSSELSIMKHDIQKQLKYLEDQEKKLNSLLATIPLDHVQRYSLEKKKRNMCVRFRQKLITQQNAISEQDKESNNTCFGSKIHSTHVSEENPNHKNNEVIKQEPHVAVYDNRNAKTYDENYNGATIGIALIEEDINQNVDNVSTFDTNQEYENSKLTVGNPTKLIDATPAVDGVYQEIDTGQTVSVLEQLDPRNLKARIIFDDEDDDDFYFELGDNSAIDTSMKCDNAIDQTNIIDITDADSNSDEARDISDCIKPNMPHSSFQVSAQERSASNKSLLLDKYKIEEVAYVKELIKESKELTCFNNKLKIEQRGATKESIKEATNQVYVAQKQGSGINKIINRATAIKRTSEHDHTYTINKSLNKCTSQNIYNIDENKFSEPTYCDDLNVVEQYKNKPDNIKANAINVHLLSTMQSINARGTTLNYVEGERDVSENKDVALSSNVNQTIENHFQLQQCSINQEHKDGINKNYGFEPNSNQNEQKMSDVVQYVDMSGPNGLDEPNHNVTNEPVDSDNKTRVSQLVKSVGSIPDSCEPLQPKSKNHESGENIDVAKSSYVNKPSDLDINQFAPIVLKFDNTKESISTTVGYKTKVDSSEANTESNDLKWDSLELEPGNSNMKSELNCVEESSSAATVRWDVNEISDNGHSKEVSAREDYHHEKEIDLKLVTETTVPLVRCDLQPFWKKHSYNNSIKVCNFNLDIFTKNVSRRSMNIYNNDFPNKQKHMTVKVYNKKDLMKNPDLNKKLRKLSEDFLLKNADLFNICRPVTVDLIRQRIHGLRVQDFEGSGERVLKKVILPDINEVRRINKSILTAQVAPITAGGSSNVETSTDVVDGQDTAEEGERSLPTERQLRAALDDLAAARARPAEAKRYCCAARRHVAVNDARRRLAARANRPAPAPVDLHGPKCGAACRCCCARLLAGELERLLAPAALAALHAAERRLLDALAELRRGDAETERPRPSSPPSPPSPPLPKKRRKSKAKTHQAPEVDDSLPKDYDEWQRQRQQLNKYFHIIPQKQDAPNILLMDKTLKSGKKLVQLLHQSSDANVKNSSTCKSDPQRTPIKTIGVKPQTKVVKGSSALAKCTNSTTVVDETTQMELTQAANQNSTTNLTQDSTRETDRNQVTDQNKLLEQTENINISKEIAILRPPMNVDQKEPPHNIVTRLVTNQPEVNDGQLMIVDNPETSQCEQNHLVAAQLTNKPGGSSMKTPPWIKQNQDVSTTDNMLLNITPTQNAQTDSDQNQTITNQPTLPTFLRIQINQQNPNQYLSVGQNMQPNLVVNQPAVMNFQNLVPTDQLINQSGHQVNQSVIMVAPTQNFLFTQPNQNLAPNQSGEQNNLCQNINVAQHLNLNKNQIEITPISDVNSLKRKRPKSPVLKEPLSKICSRMINTTNNSKDYDPNWFKKTYGNLDKPKNKVKEGNSRDIESAVERDTNMPVIKNVISLSESYVNSQSSRNNNNAVGSKLQNLASKSVGVVVKQTSFPTTSGKIVQITNLVRVTDVAVHDQHVLDKKLKNNKVPPCVIDMKTRDSLIIKKQHLSNNYHSEKRNKIGSKRRQDFDSKSNAENTQRSIIEHTSTIVSQQKVESNKNCTIGSYKIEETQNESIDAAQKTAVINTTPVGHNEREIIRRAQNDINLRGSELPVLSVKSTVAIDAGAAKVQAGVAGTVNADEDADADADAANVVNPPNTLLYITIDPLSTSIQPPDKLSAPSINVVDYFKTPPISLADFVKDKDPTNIVMLCIDLGMPLLVLDGEHLLVTDHSIHCNQPSYWTIEPNFKCQRIIFDENEKRGVDKSTSDINNLHKPTLKVKSFAKADAENALDKINGLRVPEDIYLENKSYKKLSHVPLVYAQVLRVVADVATAQRLMDARAPLHMLSAAAGRLLPPQREGVFGMNAAAVAPVSDLVARLNALPASPARRAPAATPAPGCDPVVDLDTDED